MTARGPVKGIVVGLAIVAPFWVAVVWAVTR